MKNNPHIDIEECVQRYIAAFDEIYYIAEQLAEHMGISTNYEIAKDYLDGMICKAEDLPMDLENVRDDADGDQNAD